MKRIFLLIVLLVLLVFAQIQPSLAASSTFYAPSTPNQKDAQNIDFLYRNLKRDLAYIKALPKNEQFSEKLLNSLASRKQFSDYYYSTDTESMTIRESMKLVRAFTCKASRLTTIRGLDIVSGLVNLAEESDPEEMKKLTELWKNAYESFCPDLW